MTKITETTAVECYWTNPSEQHQHCGEAFHTFAVKHCEKRPQMVFNRIYDLDGSGKFLPAGALPGHHNL